jgi:hypothetical protein
VFHVELKLGYVKVFCFSPPPPPPPPLLLSSTHLAKIIMLSNTSRAKKQGDYVVDHRLFATF